MARYESLVEEIYSDGGSMFLFVNAPPTSRSPFILDQGTHVSQTYAAWVTAYNDGLNLMVKDFGSKHDDVSFSYSVEMLQGN